MVFDLVCQHCGGRDVRRWSRGELVSVTLCRYCRHGMSVVGIAFFAPLQQQLAAAA
jgi:hypothetical protein